MNKLLLTLPVIKILIKTYHHIRLIEDNITTSYYQMKLFLIFNAVCDYLRNYRVLYIMTWLFNIIRVKQHVILVSLFSVVDLYNYFNSKIINAMVRKWWVKFAGLKHVNRNKHEMIMVEPVHSYYLIPAASLLNQRWYRKDFWTPASINYDKI